LSNSAKKLLKISSIIGEFFRGFDQMTKRVILDTDMGTDPDDALALALILASPELKLEGITCVYADAPLRARITTKLLQLRGVSDIPVRAGASKTLTGLRPAYLAGYEGDGLLEEGDKDISIHPEYGPDFIVRTVMDNPGQIHLIAVAPLTNIALALLREPRLAQNIAHLTIMGGAVRGLHNLDLNYAEHNIAADAEASHIVLSSGVPMTLVPLDVTTKVFIWRKDADRIRSGGTPYHEALARQVELFPWVRDYGASHLHDPLAVATLFQPDLVKLQALHVDVETSGRHTTGATLFRSPGENAPANVQVALEVDGERASEFILDRIAKS
jgi:purine nucleosidase